MSPIPLKMCFFITFTPFSRNWSRTALRMIKSYDGSAVNQVVITLQWTLNYHQGASLFVFSTAGRKTKPSHVTVMTTVHKRCTVHKTSIGLVAGCVCCEHRRRRCKLDYVNKYVSMYTLKVQINWCWIQRAVTPLVYILYLQRWLIKRPNTSLMCKTNLKEFFIFKNKYKALTFFWFFIF